MEIIHIVLGKANPDRMNGVNKVVYQLAQRQSAAGRKVSVWGITKDPTHNYGERNFETRLFPASKFPFGIDKSLKIALLEKKDDVLIHLHGGWIPRYASLSNFLTQQKIKYILTPHGAYNTIAMQRSAWLKKVYFHFFEKKLLTHAHRIHAIGQSEVTGLNNIFPNQKSNLQPYGYTGPAIQLNRITAKNHFILGFVGRLDIYTKGLDILLDAFEQHLTSNNGSKLWIVGDGPERSRLERIITDKKLENSVVCWGSKFGQEKFDLMQQMDVFAHPSRNEGLPASVLEAAQLGIACIVSKATNMAEYIQQFDAGIAIEDEDVAGLAQAIQSLASNVDRANIGQNAQKMVESVFSWDHILPGFDKMYAAE